MRRWGTVLVVVLALPALLGFGGLDLGLLGLDDNPWLQRRVLNIAHQGGEHEAPSDTLYALRTAVDKGADVLEIDVHATADGRIVALHDTTVDRTTNGSGRVDQMTLEQIKRLDAAYWFVPGCGTCHGRPVDDYVFRGVATGDVPPPPGFEPNDFRIPTLREVLEAFPDQLINIEIKRTFPDTRPYEHIVADLLAEYGRTDDVIVVSFSDLAMALFKLQAPQVDTAPGVVETVVSKVSSLQLGSLSLEPLPGIPNPRHVAVQVPLSYQGIEVVTEDFVDDAHQAGLAVHVWTINDAEVMRWLIDIGVDGIMTDEPTELERILADAGVRWRP